jgi:hypothetical protein
MSDRLQSTNIIFLWSTLRKTQSTNSNTRRSGSINTAKDNFSDSGYSVMSIWSV